jgi:hypothetical protein
MNIFEKCTATLQKLLFSGYDVIDFDGATIVNEAKGVVKTASEILTSEDYGKIIMVGTDTLNFTLPAVTKEGQVIKFLNIGASGNNILKITPNSADKITLTILKPEGASADATTADGLVNRLAGDDGKFVALTKATIEPGDFIELVSSVTAGGWVGYGVGIGTVES